jgi:hypothetical protein
MFTAVRRVACRGRRDHRVARASLSRRQALVVFMTSALIAVALVTSQSSMAAGVELASAVLCGAPLVTLDRRALDATEPGVARTIERFSLNDHRAVGRVPSLWQRVSRRRKPHSVLPHAHGADRLVDDRASSSHSRVCSRDLARTCRCGYPRGRSLIPAASSSTTSAMRAARSSGRCVVASIQRR